MDPLNTKKDSMSLIDANTDTCLILEDIDMYTFSPSTSQWLPRPQHACWRSGLVIKLRTPDNVNASFAVRITGRRLVCSKSHMKVMTRHTDFSDCGPVSGSNTICNLSATNNVEPGNLTTCVASCLLTDNKTKHVIVEIPNKYKGWSLCELNIE